QYQAQLLHSSPPTLVLRVQNANNSRLRRESHSFPVKLERLAGPGGGVNDGSGRSVGGRRAFGSGLSPGCHSTLISTSTSPTGTHRPTLSLPSTQLHRSRPPCSSVSAQRPSVCCSVSCCAGSWRLGGPSQRTRRPSTRRSPWRPRRPGLARRLGP